jgi:hypothetical protein
MKLLYLDTNDDGYVDVQTNTRKFMYISLKVTVFLTVSRPAQNIFSIDATGHRKNMRHKASHSRYRISLSEFYVAKILVRMTKLLLTINAQVLS